MKFQNLVIVVCNNRNISYINLIQKIIYLNTYKFVESLGKRSQKDYFRK